jgi:hypothetical protein
MLMSGTSYNSRHYFAVEFYVIIASQVPIKTSSAITKAILMTFTSWVKL